MADEGSRAWLETWALLLRLHSRLVGRLEVDMRDQHDFPLGWFDVMMQLSFAPQGRRRMHELLPSLMLTRSGLTRRIDRMEEAGLVRREQSADDARGVVVMLTSRGRARLAELVPRHAERIWEYFGRHLSLEEQDTLRAVSRRVLTALNNLPP